MSLSRRHFLRSASVLAAAAPGLAMVAGCASGSPTGGPPVRPSGFGPLVADPAGVVDLPAGFRYTIVSRTGDRMDDGLFEPGSPDGMAAFPVPGAANQCVVVRNHEIGPRADKNGAFGADFAAAARIDPELIYDRAPKNGRPLLGGATSFVFDTAQQKLVSRWLSLAGTATNCAGGPTPWGSWITCEETEETTGEHAGKPHGFSFEVDARARGLVRPEPIVAMGRFTHEAAAVDPTTGIVYQTEDTGDSLIYRYLPNRPGVLLAGGRLQALAVVEQASLDTRNWGSGPVITPRTIFQTRWIDLDAVDAPDADLRKRGAAKGAAIFARGEGIAYAVSPRGGVIYFTCTSGGPSRLGQIWRYTPSRHEGDAREREAPGTLELFVESVDPHVFDMVDNICASPFGHMVVAEDGKGDNFLRGITPDGVVYPLLRNAHPGQSELCGPCFSPDGSTLFVNIQRPGITVAVTGPWRRA